ncbi:MAG: hypothetical protein TR69_WS6001001226 [candidate division WS6 bacterium OLB20]|uniref:Glycosyl transferase family 2 n=1 Tax=candidate division WS6 bacterium OLB20 TaxID=1617426 RepID=A0A136LX46_9BACT|nr:MAG: hypothetical protein TR69_WS6001001226 [candidate division WS6 bacterium OLB20]
MQGIFRNKSQTRQYRNTEGFRNFFFSRDAGKRPEGISAMLRVRNEESKIRDALVSIDGHFQEIVVVDNASIDETVAIVRDFAAHARSTVLLYSYPFRIARCGSEHNSTDAQSVYSLVYFYNWSLAQCSYRYAAKWDADMILNSAWIAQLESLKTSMKQADRVISISQRCVYKTADNQYFEDTDDDNSEVRLFANRPEIDFAKTDNYEVLTWPENIIHERADGIAFFELRYLTENEFSHWSEGEFVTPRKIREKTIMDSLRAGDVPQGLKQIEPGQVFAERS